MGKYSQLFWMNVNNVQAQLLASLQRIQGSPLDSRVTSQIPDLVREAGILSLEMASQRSHIMLRQCFYGKEVDLKSFNEDDGKTDVYNLQVDLMTQPCMVRIGDGQGELQAEMVLIQGDIVTSPRR